MNIRPYHGILPKLGENVYVDPAAAVVGDVELGDDASLWPFVAARGDVNYIRVGARTNVQDNCVLHVTHDGPYTPGGAPLIIGADVTVGHGAILHACTIEDACLIGMHATVLDKVHVHRHAMIGAGAVVSPGKVSARANCGSATPRVACACSPPGRSSSCTTRRSIMCG